MPPRKPMLATLADAPLVDPGCVYEPKYDGIRAIVEVAPGGAVRLWSRLGNEKTRQFPEVVKALGEWAARRQAKHPTVFDGEVVALGPGGRPAGFEKLQPRMHLGSARDVAARAGKEPAALLIFDLLVDDGEDLRKRPLAARRRRLQDAIGRFAKESGPVRLSEIALGDGRALWKRAEDEGWEGIVIKVAASPYREGQRTPEWRKMKRTREQEFVVGGWTEPRESRTRFGALVLGVFEGDRLVPAGSVGSGFSAAEIERVWKLLGKRTIDDCPFAWKPITLGPAHWVRPDLVAEVRFTEWTSDGLLRQPVYLGMREDKPAREVGREGGNGAPTAKARGSSSRSTTAGATTSASGSAGPSATAVVATLAAIERSGGNGSLALPDGNLNVTNLKKMFWPDLGITKGDLMRHYALVAPHLLPIVKDRPLIMRRHPDGIDGPAFYQQRAPEAPPPGVRTATIPDDELPSRLVGGSLLTLLYMVQLATISQDPWFARLPRREEPVEAAIDLDPLEGVSFGRVLDVARWVRDELGRLGIEAFPKTSGASGLHIYLPLPPGTTFQSGMLLCQLVATMVARKHHKVATVERAVASRPAGTVYVDYLQNIHGKSIACAYSARASAFAGVSTPLRWREVDDGFDTRDFNIRTTAARLAEVGDLWAPLRTSPGVDIRAVLVRAGAPKPPGRGKGTRTRTR